MRLLVQNASNYFHRLKTPAYFAASTFAVHNLYIYSQLVDIRKNLKPINNPEQLKKIEKMKKKFNFSEDIDFFEKREGISEQSLAGGFFWFKPALLWDPQALWHQFALAHEFSHHKRKHALINSLLLTGSVGLLYLSKKMKVKIGLALAYNLGAYKLSNFQERQADHDAMKMVSKKALAKAITVFAEVDTNRKLFIMELDDPAVPLNEKIWERIKLLSDVHPPEQERIEYLSEYLKNGHSKI